jgi:hypothetical protein
MAHKRRRKSAEPPSGQPATPPPRSQPPRPLHKNIWLNLSIGFAFTLLMWGLATVIEKEQLPIGVEIRGWVYGLIQTRLGLKGGGETRVVVVDIANAPLRSGKTGAPLGPNDKRDPQDYTDRDYLRKLVLAILEQKPKAIGLDIDFTPYPAQISDDDQLLACFLALSSGAPVPVDALPKGGIDPLCYQTPSVPVFVATYQSIALGPMYALERPEYSTMAAFAGAVKPDSGEAPRKTVYSIAIPYGTPGGPSWLVNSLATALFGARADTTLPAFNWAAERLAVTQNDYFLATEFYVNYGVIDRLRQTCCTVLASDLMDPKKASSANALTGKYVLIGRATDVPPTDQFSVPGHHVLQRYPGVFLHACAIHTLDSGPLLGLLLPGGRLVLDLFLFLLIFAFVELIRWGSRRLFGWEPSEKVLHMAVTVGIVAIAILIGIYGMSKIQLMWDDSPFVGAGLLAHAILGHLFTRF